MMIRINLLPVRAVKKRELGVQVVTLLGLVVVATLVANYFWYDSRESARQQSKARTTATQAKIAELEKVIGEVNNINQRKAEVERKLAVLDELRRGRSGPVRMMDAFSLAMPKKLWVKSFTEQSNNVSLAGGAFSHDDVAEFMRSLGTVVWTPRGIGRIVEQRRDATTSRVELTSGDATVQEFPVADVKRFFTNVELKKAAQERPGSADAEPLVSFELTLSANYAL
jgi:type IV pilus assembly protein PilN